MRSSTKSKSHFIHFSRPSLSRKRSKSVPTLATPDFNFSAIEAGLIFSAAERATARRRRPFSMDSPGAEGEVANPFPTRSVQSPLRKMELASLDAGYEADYDPDADCAVTEAGSEAETAIQTPFFSRRNPQTPDNWPLRQTVDTEKANEYTHDGPTSTRSAPSFISTSSESRRRVEDPNLKAYADGLYSFTKKKLGDVAGERPGSVPDLIHDQDSEHDTAQPEEKEEEKEGEDDWQPGYPMPPHLSSRFSDWSANSSRPVTGTVTAIDESPFFANFDLSTGTPGAWSTRNSGMLTYEELAEVNQMVDVTMRPPSWFIRAVG
ncbi:hypothetical protein EJ06DRAFT_552446 [Trichodelitschia bisporula]|uniref:Uncharacterized protein n=1 Tax=Trichodelitschia bisporula TaxID=703511 RepID=A0A6G1I9J6_9PEZI|nr:hypothetical protein EJ06DRAFT_552446 [Trichodelitschia bisporula]